MKPKIYFTILIMCLFALSCGKYGTRFKIKNESNRNLDLVLVSNGFSSTQFKKIKIGETKEGFIDFSENDPKHDGNYKVKLYYNDTVKKRFFGYYSNGVPSGVIYEITIKKDTIIINEYIE